MKNTAPAIALPSEQRNTHHHPAKSWSGEIFVGFFCLVVGGWLAWGLAIHILREMGYRRPAETIGYGIAWIAIAFFVLIVIGRWASSIIAQILDTYKEIRLAQLDFDAHIATKQLQAKVAEPIANNSTIDGDARKGQIIQQVMALAFQFYDDNGRNYNHRDAKPWSWRQAKDIIIEGKPIGETEARKVKGWLQDYQLIEDGGNGINLTRFPSMTQVNRLLRREFIRPIMYGTLSQNQDNGYVHVEK